MKKHRMLMASAVAAVLSMPLTAMAQSAPVPKPKVELERCYGVAKAGKNDCYTATASCAGTAQQDRQGDAWISLPAGSCDKIVGGSTVPKKSESHRGMRALTLLPIRSKMSTVMGKPSQEPPIDPQET